MKSRSLAAVAALFAGLLIGSGQLASQDSTSGSTYEKDPKKAGGVAGLTAQPRGWMQIPMPPATEWRPNTFMPPITPEAKMKAAQTALFINPLSLRDMINMMVAKKQVDEGISFDEVIESMDLRANALNMMKVSHNTPYRVIAGITGKPSPRMEIIAYCDVQVMREIVDFVPEFIAFLPCRIAVMEDADGKIWLVTLDWDVRWLDTSQNPNRISAELRERAVKIREHLESIMEAGARGEL